MTRLESTTYLDHIRSESTRFRDVLADCDPAARVPSCPDWSAADLLWHLTKVQHWWTAMIANRPESPDEMGYADPERPVSYDAMLSRYDALHDEFVSTLAAADPAEPAWTWSSPDNHTVGFTYRRQAHEALIHRVDAELAAGHVTALDPALAADGVDEVLDVMFGGLPPWGAWTAGEHLVRIDCVDTDTQVWSQLGRFTGTDPEGTTHHEDDQHVVADPGVEPDVIIEGTADDLDAWLWRRRDNAGITVIGDPGVYEKWLTCVNHPIN